MLYLDIFFSLYIRKIWNDLYFSTDLSFTMMSMKVHEYKLHVWKPLGCMISSADDFAYVHDQVVLPLSIYFILFLISMWNLVFAQVLKY